MLYFSEIHRQILNTLKSNTFSQLMDAEIEEHLNMLLIRAIGNFRYPRIPLDYQEIEDEITKEKDYVFTEEVTQKEINVLLTLMKVYWLEQQLDNESLFEDLFYDRDVKTFSRANMIRTLNDRYKDAKEESKIAQYNYSRERDNRPTFGDIYE